MTLTQEQRLVLDAVRRVAREVLYPLAPEYDRKAEYPWPQLKALAELGLLGMTTPEEWGGVGLDSVTWALALEELAAADPSVAVIVSVTSGLPQYMLLRFGSEAQKRRYLVPLARGEWIGAFCLTEPQAGSDAKSLRAEARRVKGGFVLNGVKSWITSAGHAHLYVVMARTEKGISAFLVEKGTPGLSFGRPEEKMGLHAAHTAEVRLEEVFVPEENLLGEEGRGLAYALAGLDSGRVGVAAQAVGIARGAFEIAKAYAEEREQFGKKLKEHQAIAFKIADMHVKIAAARALVLEAARKKDRGRGSPSRPAPPSSSPAPPPWRSPGRRSRSWGVRLPPGLPGGAVLPGRQGDGDLRGHLGDPAPRHRPGALPLARPALLP